MGRGQRIIDIFGRIGTPGDDIDALSLQFLHHVLHPGTLHTDAGADGVHIGFRRTDCNLGPESGLAADTHDLDNPFGDLRDLQLEQLGQEFIACPGEHQLGIPAGLPDLHQIGPDPVTLFERTFGNLLVLGENGVRPAKVDDHVTPLKALDDTTDHLTQPVLEHIKAGDHPFDIFSVEKSFSFANFSLIDPPKPKLDPFQLIMANPLHQAIAQESTDRDGGLGSRKSFIPPLGEILWSSEDIVAPEEGSNNQNIEEIDNLQFWHAYIYRHPNDYAIGYIRIPHYLTSTQEVIGFGKIIDMMNEQTDALVIDQVHNFGGFIHIQYLLASMLTHQPLITPLHRIKITQKDAKEAYQILEIIKLIEREINFAEKMNQEPKVEGEEGLNHQELLFRKAYCELILENWNKGQYLTDPTPVIGIDHINPHPTYRYEKPILMLIDEMDFSGGDFMPAILQDNQRAYLFGARTAGAGGYVSQFEFPNINGIASCSYTASIAERVDFKKIENLGVTPDIPYHITLDDVKNGFCGYIDGVNQSIDLIIKNNK